MNLNVAGTALTGLRATGSFTTNRTINLAQLTNGIEVTAGNTLTLTAPFGTMGGAVVKNDNGTLAINANNAPWTTGLQINSGIVAFNSAASMGTGPITISPNAAVVGAALQLSNGVTVGNAISLASVNNVAFGGINAGGQLESVSGNSAISTQMAMNFDAMIGADAGTLSINGGILTTNATPRTLGFTGAGTINVNSDLTEAGGATQFFGINRYGTGITNFTFGLTTNLSNNLTIFGGTMDFSGAGRLSNVTTNTAMTINPGGTLLLDDSGTATASRLGSTDDPCRWQHHLPRQRSRLHAASGVLMFNRGEDTITVVAGAGGTTLNFSGGVQQRRPRTDHRR